MEFTISMPRFLMVETSKKKGYQKFYINLNQYRNWNHFVENKIKKEYSLIAKSKLPNVKLGKIKLELKMFKKDKRRQDRANQLSIQEKYFCDSMVEAGILEDDDDNHIESTFYHGSEVCKNDPRIEIRVIEIEQREPDLSLF